jgi:hypothetical protein
MPLGRHRERLVERASAVRARHLELREQAGGLTGREQAQELDDRRRAPDLP